MNNQELLQKMKDDMNMRGFSHYTYDAYIGKAKDIMRYFNKPMEEVTIEELTEVLPTITDKKYKKMLEEQLTFLNNHKADLFKKINMFQNMYRKGHLSDNIKSRSYKADFLMGDSNSNVFSSNSTDSKKMHLRTMIIAIYKKQENLTLNYN